MSHDYNREKTWTTKAFSYLAYFLHSSYVYSSQNKKENSQSIPPMASSILYGFKSVLFVYENISLESRFYIKRCINF